MAGGFDKPIPFITENSFAKQQSGELIPIQGKGKLIALKRKLLKRLAVQIDKAGFFDVCRQGQDRVRSRFAHVIYPKLHALRRLVGSAE